MSLDALLTDEECAQFIAATDQTTRFRLGQKYFMDSFASVRVGRLVRYAWDKHWSALHPIPELVDAALIQQTLGRGIYRVLGIHSNTPQELLHATLSGYGFFDAMKCAFFLERSDDSSRSRFEDAFFQGSYAVSNVRRLVRYTWKHIWKRTYIIPEAVGWIDIKRTLGDGVYTGVQSLGVKKGNSYALFSSVIASYGHLRYGKAAACVSLYEDGLSGMTPAQHRELRKKFNTLFFAPSHPTFSRNAKAYVTAFSERHRIPIASLSSYRDVLPSPLR